MVIIRLVQRLTSRPRPWCGRVARVLKLLLPLNLGLMGKGLGRGNYVEMVREMRLDMAQAPLVLERRPLILGTNHVSMWTIEYAMVKLSEEPSLLWMLVVVVVVGGVGFW